MVGLALRRECVIEAVQDSYSSISEEQGLGYIHRELPVSECEAFEPRERERERESEWVSESVRE